jgi:hypothetical protein
MGDKEHCVGLLLGSLFEPFVVRPGVGLRQDLAAN